LTLSSTLRWLVPAGVAFCCGCSIVFIRPVPTRFANESEVRCSSPGWAIADAAAAVAVLALDSLAAGIAESSNGYNGCDTNKSLCQHADRSAGYWMAGVLGASALYGAIGTTTCNAKLDEQSLRAAAAPAPGQPEFAPSAR
jgi:hypothetical protein